jgi:phospholipid/cholesterol/gamma-HCH transport system substrate-binding protein
MRISIENKARLAFIALALLGTVAALGWYFVAAGRFVTYQLSTQDSVSGLIVDAPVEFHGVEVGRVKRVELTASHSVSILLDIKRQAPVTSATVATITSRGLAARGFMGYVYVALEDADSHADPLLVAAGEPYPKLRCAPSSSVNLDTMISRVNANVQVVTALLQTVLDEKTVTSLKRSVGNLQQVTQTLAANDKRLATIVANTEQASRRFGPLLNSSSDTFKALQTQVIPEAYNALTNLARLENSSSDTVRALQTQVMPEAYNTLANLNRLSTSMSGAAAKINATPRSSFAAPLRRRWGLENHDDERSERDDPHDQIHHRDGAGRVRAAGLRAVVCCEGRYADFHAGTASAGHAAGNALHGGDATDVPATSAGDLRHHADGLHDRSSSDRLFQPTRMGRYAVADAATSAGQGPAGHALLRRGSDTALQRAIHPCAAH